MEDILREYEVRLFDSNGRLLLVVPVIAGSEDEANAHAARLAARETAARFDIRPQMSSRGYRAQKPAAPGS
jgi:hypothetical protein